MPELGDLADKIIAYEEGNLSEEETIELFQALVNNGAAWTLQGHYGRTAEQLLSAGLIQLPPKAEVPARIERFKHRRRSPSRLIVNGYPVLKEHPAKTTKPGRIILVDRGVPAHDNTHHHRYVTAWQGQDEAGQFEDGWEWGHYFTALPEAEADYEHRCKRGH